MSVVKLACVATVIAVAVAQAMDMPEKKRIALWADAQHFFGIQPKVTAQARVFVDKPPKPNAALPVASGVETIEPDRGGQFNVMAETEGQHFPALIDTGATMVCLTSDVAAQLGYYPSPSEFRYHASTANGTVTLAKVTLRELRLGTILVRDVPAMIAPQGALSGSLVGMSFLTKLSSFRIGDGRLILQQ